MANNRLTPFIKRMRTNGGTIYTFSSSVEDIGLNINERNNKVKISHFALLDIPDLQRPSDPSANKFNVLAIPGAFNNEQDLNVIKDGRVLIAESFQNYALNLEANLLNLSTYNSTLQRTVSERVFWKWLKETGAIRWTKDSSGNFTEEITTTDGSLYYKPVVKYIGRVSAGNVKTDNFGTYNETYLLVPTSHGSTNAYFYQHIDDNYKHGMVIEGLGTNILGRENYTKPHPDILSYKGYYDFVDSSILLGTYDTSVRTYNSGNFESGWWYTQFGYNSPTTSNAYVTDSSDYLIEGYNCELKYDNGSGDSYSFMRSNVEAISLQLDLDELKTIYNDNTLSYDKIATDYSLSSDFNFNVALIYYTVYDSTGTTEFATNLLGVYFLDAPSGNSLDIKNDGIQIPSLEKIQSDATGFGTSYQLRLNIRTDNIFDDTQATIVDKSTSDQVYPEDFNKVFNNLNEAVKILMRNQETITNINTQYLNLTEQIDLLDNNINSIQSTVEESQEQDIGSLIDAENINYTDAIGTYNNKVTSGGLVTFRFKSVSGGPGINVTEPSVGLIQIDASGSFEGVYNSNLNPTREMPEAVGGLDASTKVSDLLGKTYTQLFDLILFPAIDPTFVDPYSTLATSPTTTIYEIGDSFNLTLTTDYDPGAIKIDGTKIDDRGGDPSVYNYDGAGLSNFVYSTSSQNVQDVSVAVAQGFEAWKSRVYYEEGPQPVDSHGDPYGSPEPAGYTNWNNFTIEGVYPLYATTSSITILSKLSLISMINTSEHTISMVSESGVDKQKFDLADAWPNALQGIKTYNSVSGTYEYQGGGASASLTYWNTSSTTHTIQGNSVNYTRYTYNGADRSSINIKLIF